jgi:hypothetical protein
MPRQNLWKSLSMYHSVHHMRKATSSGLIKCLL